MDIPILGTVFTGLETVFSSFVFPSVLIGIVIFVVLLKHRRVVETNMVHIVQSRKKTTSYGTGKPDGNVYYGWPSWFVGLGVTVIELPVSNFDLSLKDYEAYDKDRVPFKVDVTAFFRIQDTTVAAQRVSSVKEMQEQLTLIVQGAVRKVLASDDIDSIMLERSKFGESFTEEVADQLKQWGVESVKAMELMDIRDAHESKVIANIMAKKTSGIEKESRIEVANNMKAAETAEIEADQEVDIRKQQAAEAVGEREAEKDRAIGIAKEKSQQQIKIEAKITAEKEMDLKRVQQVQEAAIIKEKEIIKAEQDKTIVVFAAEGRLEEKKKEAEGIKLVGEANAAAATAMQKAPVEAQIMFAKEVGSNEGYQKYLAIIEAIKAWCEVGGQQAEALQGADIKVIANSGSGSPTSGMSKVMDLFSSKGGTEIASMIEAVAQSPLGESLFEALLPNMGKSVAKKEVKSEENISDLSDKVSLEKPEN